MSMPSSKSCIDTLRLNSLERQDLLHRLERESAAQARLEMRSDPRIAYNDSSAVVMKLYHPGGSSINYLIRPRNISRSGIAFLHGNYVHVDSRCGLLLKTVRNEPRLVHGKVVWCRHVMHRVHEVGVQFESPIVLNAFVESLVRTDGSDDETSHELPTLQGKLLYIEDSIDDQELLQFHLGQLGVELETVGDALEAIERLQKNSVDLTLANVCLPGMSGLELAQMLRAEGYTRPLVLLTANPRTPTREEAIAAGATAVLHKPYTLETLLVTVRDHLPEAPAQPEPPEPVLSEHWNNRRMRPLILNFLTRLDGQLPQFRRLTEAEGQRNDALLEKMCLDLRGSAGGYGFPQISQAAERLYQHCIDKAESSELQRTFAELEVLCRSACDTAASAPVGAPIGA